MSFSEHKVALILETDQKVLDNWQKVFQSLFNSNNQFKQKHNDLERGLTQPYLLYFQLLQEWKSCAGKKADPSALVNSLEKARCLAAAEKLKQHLSIVPSYIWYFPTQGENKQFGRKSEQDILETIIKSGNETTLVTGLSGMGKTLLLKTTMFSCKQENINFIWLDCSDGLAEPLKQIGNKLLPNLQNDMEEIDLLSKNLLELRRRTDDKIVIIMDDLNILKEEIYKEMENFSKQNFLFILISKFSHEKGIKKENQISLCELSKEEAIKFIMENLPEELEENGTELFKITGGYPHVLRQAVMSIKARKNSVEGCSIEKYISTNEGMKDLNNGWEKLEKALFSTLSQIKERSKMDKIAELALKLVQLLVNIRNKKIEYDFLFNLISSYEVGTEKKDFEKSVELLRSFHILIKAEDGVLEYPSILQSIISKDFFPMEIDVSEVSENLKFSELDDTKIQHVVTLFKNTFNTDCPLKRGNILSHICRFEESKHSREMAESVGEHLLIREENIEKYDIDLEEKATKFLLAMGWWEVSIRNLEIIYRRRWILNGCYSHKSYETSRALAYAYYINSQYEESSILFEAVLKWRERELGEKEPEKVAETKVNLANIYIKTGNFDEAEVYYKEAFLTYGKTKVEGNKSLATFHSFGYMYLEKQDFYAAKCIFKLVWREWEKRERKTWDDKIRISDTKYNLARALYGLGRVEKAISLMENVLEEKSSLLGKNHQSVRKVAVYVSDYKKAQGEKMGVSTSFNPTSKAQTTIATGTLPITICPFHQSSQSPETSRSAMLHELEFLEKRIKLLKESLN